MRQLIRLVFVGLLIIGSNKALAQDIGTEAAQKQLRIDFLKKLKKENQRIEVALERLREDNFTREVQKQLNDYSRVISFKTGKASIKAESNVLLTDIIQILNEYPNAKFTIEGHTDKVGSRQLNQRLSEARAIAVKEFLVDNGIDESRLSTLGYGEDKPITNNSTRAGRAENKRIEINFVDSLQSHQAAITLKKLGIGENELPPFPWPPPEYSSKLVIHSQKSPLRIFERCTNFGCVDSIISRALKTNKYDYSFYLVSPEDYSATPADKVIRGFTIVTMLEQFNKEDGSYKDGEARTMATIDYVNFSFWDKIKSFIFPREGYFRVIAFVVTDLGFDSKGELTQEEAISLVRSGSQSIPNIFGNLPFTKDFTITALIYEFRASAPKLKAQQNIPPVLQAEKHINGAKLSILIEH